MRQIALFCAVLLACPVVCAADGSRSGGAGLLATEDTAAPAATSAGGSAHELAVGALQEAQKVAAALPDAQSRALALADIAVVLATVDGGRARVLLDEARHASALVEDPLESVIAERGVMVRWTLVDRAEALRRFPSVVEKCALLPYRGQRSLALREVGRALVGLDDELARLTLKAAREEAGALESGVLAAAGLRDVAAVIALLDLAEADAVMEEAVARLDGAPADDPGVAPARIAIAGAWAIWNPAKAVAQAGALSGVEADRARVEIVRTLVTEAAGGLREPTAPGSVPPARESQRESDLLARALELAGEVTDDGQRALAIALGAGGLPDAQAGVAMTLARQAMALGAQLQGDEALELRKLCAAILARRDVDEALELARGAADMDGRAEVVGAIAVVVARRDGARAETILNSIETLPARDAATAAVVGRLLAREGEMERARSLVKGLRSPRRKASALVAVARAALAQAASDGCGAPS